MPAELIRLMKEMLSLKSQQRFAEYYKLSETIADMCGISIGSPLSSEQLGLIATGQVYFQVRMFPSSLFSSVHGVHRATKRFWT